LKFKLYIFQVPALDPCSMNTSNRECYPAQVGEDLTSGHQRKSD
jgi:hypothetical protein